MLRHRSYILLVVAMLSALAGGLFLRYPGSFLAKAELAASDFLLEHGHRAPANSRIHFLAIDNDSMSLDAQAD